MDKNKIVDLAKRGPISRHDLRKALGVTNKQISDMLGRSMFGHRLFEQVFEGNSFFHFLPDPENIIVEEKIWSVIKCSKKDTPWLWIQFPNTDWKKILVVPISDLHWGSNECDVDKFKEYVEWIKSKPNVFAFINGDLLENALRTAPGSAPYKSTMSPSEQTRDIVNVLSPIAHKILWAQPGNHEERSVKAADIDPLYWICRVLNIPYYNQPIFADILWNGHRFTFYAFHGAAGSRTAGGRLNAATRPIAWTQFTMFYVMGHVHEAMGNSVIRQCVLRKYDKDGKLVGLKLVDREQYVIICSAWLKFFGGYGAQTGYSPPTRGATPCILRANGGYETSE